MKLISLSDARYFMECNKLVWFMTLLCSLNFYYYFVLHRIFYQMKHFKSCINNSPYIIRILLYITCSNYLEFRIRQTQRERSIKIYFLCSFSKTNKETAFKSLVWILWMCWVWMSSLMMKMNILLLNHKGTWCC